MTFSFHPEAEDELNQAIDFYEAKQPGLGFDFATEAYAAVQRAVNFPTAWPLVSQDIRRCLFKRFPYAVLYAEEGNGIIVLAVMHLHRHPDYWKHRASG